MPLIKTSSLSQSMNPQYATIQGFLAIYKQFFGNEIAQPSVIQIELNLPDGLMSGLKVLFLTISAPSL